MLHPEHTSIAEAELNRSDGTFEVALRVDVAHLEETLAVVADRRVAIDDADVDQMIAEHLEQAFRVRVVPSRVGCTLRFVGKKIEGFDVWIFFEVVLPWCADPDPALEVRHRVMLDVMMRQINTITFSDGEERGTLHFAGQDQGWKRLELVGLGAWLRANAPRLGRVERRDGTGARLVLVPALASDERLFGPFLERDVGHGVDVVTIAGFGGTAPPPPTRHGWRDRAWCDWAVAALVAHVKAAPEPVVLVGSSFGAGLALRVALAAPASVRGVVCLDGVHVVPINGRFDTSDDMRAHRVRIADRAERNRNLAAWRADRIGVYEAMVTTPAHRALVLEMIEQTTRNVETRYRLEHLAANDLHALHALAVPIQVVIAGAQPEGPTREAWDHLKGLTRRITVSVAPRARHLIPLDDPEAVHAAVGSILESG